MLSNLKLCVYKDLKEEEYLNNLEQTILKYKWDKMGEPDEPNPANESTQEVATEEEKAEEERVIEQGKVEEAKSRSIFDRDEMTLGYSRQRATDMKMNTRVIFPGAMSNEEESKLQVARTSLL